MIPHQPLQSNISKLKSPYNRIHFFPQRAKALLSSSSEELRLEALLGRLAKNESLFRRRSNFARKKKLPWTKQDSAKVFPYKSCSELKVVFFSESAMHYEPKARFWDDNYDFTDFRFSIFFSTHIHLEVSHFYIVGLKNLYFGPKFKIFLVKVGLKHCFLSFEQNLLSKKPEAKSKKIPKSPFSEIFGKSLLLGVLGSIQCT